MNTLSPQSIDEIQPWLASRIEKKEPLKICGKGSRFMPKSNSNTEIENTLNMQNLNGVKFFDPDDLVVGIEAGMSIKNLNAMLAEKDMMLPANPWYADSCIGSVTASNDLGPNRMYMGGLRDSIIGLEYINGQGDLVQAGGKVVKNVSGYDLTRMMLGSMGGLGILCSVNFKISPKPVEPHAMIGTFENASWLNVVKQINQKKVPLDWIQSLSHEETRWLVGLGYSGNTANRNRIEKEIRAISGDSFQVIEDGSRFENSAIAPGDHRFDGFLTHFKNHWKMPESHFHVCASMPTKNIAQFPLDNFLKNNFQIIVHPTGGDIHFIHSTATIEEQKDLLSEVKSSLQNSEAKLQWVNAASDATYEDLGEMGLASGYPLVQRLKRHLDPAGIFHSPYYDVELNS